jgi:hypothetical protein
MSIAITASLLILSPILMGAQENSLIRFAREHGGTAIRYRDHLAPPISTIEGSLVDLSAVIVKGSIRSVKTRLSADESAVETVFEVVPFRYFRGSVPMTERPGQTRPLIVSRTGGTLVVDGLHLETTDLFPEDESFSVGDTAFLFLSRDPRNREEFRLTDGPFGAFRVVKGTVTALTQAVAQRRGDGTPTVDEFERRVQVAIAAHRGR